MEQSFFLSYFAYRNMKMDTFEKMVKKYENIYIQDKGTIEEYFAKQYALDSDELQKMQCFFSHRKEKLQEENIVLHAIAYGNVLFFEMMQKENMFVDFWKDDKTVVGHVLAYYIMTKEEMKKRLKEIFRILLSMKADVSFVYRMDHKGCNVLFLINLHGALELMPILETYKDHFPEHFRKEYQAFRLKQVFK